MQELLLGKSTVQSIGILVAQSGQVTVEPVFGFWVVLALSVITLTSIWLTISTKELSHSSRLILVGLRLTATILLILAWLRPAFWTTSSRDTEGAIAVLMDRSLSMTLPSASLGKTRWDIQQEVWEKIRNSTDLQVGGSKLVPYFYDKELIPVSESEMPSLRSTFNSQPDGRLTDLGRALADVSKLQTNPPLRGVIMIGDGTQTLIPPQSDPLMVARQMAQLDQPIYFVGVGSAGESGQMRDVAVESMPEEISAFANKKVSVPVVISAQGLQNEPIEVQLKLKARGEAERVLFSRKVLASRPSERIPLDFQVQLDEPGEYLLVAEASVDVSEQITSNNQAASFVSVREGGVRILLLEGQPRYEQLYLKASLDASIDFDLEYQWLPSRNRDRWPIDLTRKVDPESYEVFIVGDLDSRAVSPASWQRIASRVSQGAGLLLLGGYHSFDAGGYQSSPLAQAIPVQMTQQRQQGAGRIDDRFHYPQEIRLQPTRPHPVTSLLPEPDNSRLWSSLQPMQGMNRFPGVSSAPGTQILLAGPQDQPALVAGEFGAGRVLAFAADSTWQWYLAGDDMGHKKAHQTFWRQAVLWLVNREKLQEGFRLTIPSRRQEIDATPKIKVEWYGGSDNKPIPANLQVRLNRNDEFLRNLDIADLGGDSREATAVGLDQAGIYLVTLNATDGDGSTYTADLAFMVQDGSRELATPAADWRMISNLVSAGEAAGSQSFLPEETDELIAKLRERQNEAKVSTIDRRRLGDAAWDSWLFFLLFCSLMSAEWILRKRWQLP